MWTVLIPYLHQLLVFGGLTLEPWQWFSWFSYYGT